MALEIGAAVLRAAVPSLGKLLKYEWGLDKTVKDGLKNLQDELMSMDAFLGDVSGMLPDLELGEQMKLQVRQARELSHAIETRLHSFMARIESTKGSLLSGPTKLVINHEIASYIKDTRKKVEEVRKRYGPYPCKSSLENTSTRVDPRMFAMYTRDKESDPIGIDGAIAELTEKLSNGNLVSIVGMGGMGKTTLAQAVYDKMKGGFDCEAFVSIGLRADMKKVLIDIFDELQIEIHGHAPDLGQLASQLQNFLMDKRYVYAYSYRCLLVM
ncbi:hypothetical protein ACQJBY_013022 [Aegilops geniculata]